MKLNETKIAQITFAKESLTPSINDTQIGYTKYRKVPGRDHGY